MTERVLVTGATGFVGIVLCEALAQAGYRVRAALRTAGASPIGVSEQVVTGEIEAATDWRQALNGVDLVVHAAARVHMLRDAPRNAQLYLDANVGGTAGLAQAAGRMGVRRLVFLSSIKVNGERTGTSPFGVGDEPRPCDDYGRSKLLAEGALRKVAAANGLETVIVRPPLVYGQGVRANFLRLMRWVDRRLPLPFGAIENRRSLVSVWNLADLILTLLTHERAAGATWLVSDGVDLSTPELVHRLAHALSRSPNLVSVPRSTLIFVARLLGRSDEIARLCDSLTVDMSETRRTLGWAPPMGVEEALARTAHWYRGSRP